MAVKWQVSVMVARLDVERVWHTNAPYPLYCVTYPVTCGRVERGVYFN